MYNKTLTKTYKTFLAIYKPAGGVIRVVVVPEEHGWYAFYCTHPSATAHEMVETFLADRSDSPWDDPNAALHTQIVRQPYGHRFYARNY